MPLLAVAIGPVRASPLSFPTLLQLRPVAATVAAVALATVVRLAYPEHNPAPAAGTPKQCKAFSARHRPRLRWTARAGRATLLLVCEDLNLSLHAEVQAPAAPAAGALTGFPQIDAARSPRAPLHASGVEYVGLHPSRGITAPPGTRWTQHSSDSPRRARNRHRGRLGRPGQRR